RGLAAEVRRALRADRRHAAARRWASRECASRAAYAAGVPPRRRGSRAQGAARPPQHLHGAGALLARLDLRSRGGRSPRSARDGWHRSGGGRAMTNAPVLILLAVSAIWPFGRDRDRNEPTGTIRDLERSNVVIETSARIDGSEAKAMESYRLFLDVASDD